MTEGILIRGSRFVDRVDVIARDDQDVRRRLRTQIIERYADLIFENLRRLNLASCNFAENTIVHFHTRYVINYGSLRRQFLGRHIVADAFDIGADRSQLSDDRFIPAVYMVNTLNNGLTGSGKRGKNERCRSTQV